MKLLTFLLLCVVVVARDKWWRLSTYIKQPLQGISEDLRYAVDTLKTSLGDNVPQITGSLDELSAALRNINVGFSIGPETRILLEKLNEKILAEAANYRNMTGPQLKKIVELCNNVQVMVDKYTDRGLTDLEILFSNIESYAALSLSCLAFTMVFMSLRDGFAKFASNLFDASLVFCSLTLTLLFGLYLTDSIDLFMNHELLVAICVVVCIAPLLLHLLSIEDVVYNISSAVVRNGGSNVHRPRLLWKAYALVICTIIVVVSMSFLTKQDVKSVDVDSYLNMCGNKSNTNCAMQQQQSSFGQTTRIVPSRTWEYELPGGQPESFSVQPGKYLVKMRGFVNNDRRMFGSLVLEKLVTAPTSFKWELVGDKLIADPQRAEHLFGHAYIGAPSTLTDFVLIDVDVITTYRVNLITIDREYGRRLKGVEVQLMRIA
ncbi:hypothetical protein EON65_52100 [archaeon]|nr:MAG: hypothetical protein EON65_52100 [archaeon]